MGFPITFKYLTSEDKIAGVMILLIITTPIALFVGHIYSDMWQLGYPTTYNINAFHRSPWIRISILLSITTYLAANTGKEIIGLTVEYLLVYFLIIYLLIYPSPSNYDYDGTIYGITMVGVAIIHGFGFRSIRNFIKSEQKEIDESNHESNQMQFLYKSKYYKSLKKMITDYNIDRSVIISILEKVGTEAKIILASHEVVYARVYNLPIDENHWYFYIESPLCQSNGLLTSSWLIVVSKDTHEIIYNGSANDEG